MSFAATHSGTAALLSARNSTSYCYRLPNNFPSVKELLDDTEINEMVMHPICRAVCRVALLYYSRVSEILNLTVEHVVNPDRVICAGSKRGSAYMLYLPDVSRQTFGLPVSLQKAALFPVSYMQCYRSFKRAGIRLGRSGRSNHAVCHVGRYQVSAVPSAVLEKNQLGDLLHHKSKTSVLYYLS